MLLRSLIVLVFGLIALQPALAQKRIALLIGNQDYAAEVGRLRNPINDVTLIASSLRKIGFVKDDIRIIQNARRRDILRAVDEHARKLKAAGAGAISFVYYSGHGAANREDNRNYVIPVEVKSGAAGRLRSLHQFLSRADHDLGVRLHGGQLALETHVAPMSDGPMAYHLLNAPLYLTPFLADMVRAVPESRWAARATGPDGHRRAPTRGGRAGGSRRVRRRPRASPGRHDRGSA